MEHFERDTPKSWHNRARDRAGPVGSQDLPQLDLALALNCTFARRVNSL